MMINHSAKFNTTQCIFLFNRQSAEDMIESMKRDYIKRNGYLTAHDVIVLSGRADQYLNDAAYYFTIGWRNIDNSQIYSVIRNGISGYTIKLPPAKKLDI